MCHCHTFGDERSEMLDIASQTHEEAIRELLGAAFEPAQGQTSCCLNAVARCDCGRGWTSAAALEHRLAPSFQLRWPRQNSRKRTPLLRGSTLGRRQSVW